MIRHFGLQSSRAGLGGMSTDATATRDIYAPRDLPPLPCGSILNPPLPRSEFAQSMIDVLCVFFGALFVTVTGLGVAFSLFVLWFVQI